MYAPRVVHACTFSTITITLTLTLFTYRMEVIVFVIVEKHISRSLVIVNVIVFLANQIRQETTAPQDIQISASPDSG